MTKMRLHHMPDARVSVIDAADGTCVATVQTTETPTRDLLVTMGINAWLDPFELQRFKVLSHSLNARVVIPETPGVSRRRSRLTLPEVGAALLGDLRPTARRMGRAARAAVPDVGLTRPLHVLGYSLGASTAAALLAVVNGPDSPSPSSLTLVEPVATRRWPVRELMAAVAEEDRRTADYLARNQSWPDAVDPSEDLPAGPRPHVHRPSLVALGAAVRAGRLVAALELAAQHHQTMQTFIVHGRSSLLSTPDGCRRLLAVMEGSRLPARDLPVSGGHAAWHSLDDVVDLASQLDQAWSPAS